MTLEVAQKIADAVLYEGYVLYPYRASAKKNQMRWQFGVLAPPGYAERVEDETSFSKTECLLDPTDSCRLQVRALLAAAAVSRGRSRRTRNGSVPFG